MGQQKGVHACMGEIFETPWAKTGPLVHGHLLLPHSDLCRGEGEVCLRDDDSWVRWGSKQVPFLRTRRLWRRTLIQVSFVQLYMGKLGKRGQGRLCKCRGTYIYDACNIETYMLSALHPILPCRPAAVPLPHSLTQRQQEGASPVYS